jgi:KDO2-lipid IV(A) lauroyltransferase
MVFDESPLKDLYRLVVWGPYRRAICGLPHGVELRVNRLLGRGVALGARGKKARVVENLKRAFPKSSDLAGIATGTFSTHFMEQYVSWSFGRIDLETHGKYLEIRGLEHLERAAAEGGGVVLMHPHMGPAQMPLMVLGVKGFKMNQIGGGGVSHKMSSRGEWAEGLRHKFEEQIPAVIWDGAGFMRGVLRALGRGEIVMCAMDGTGGGKELGRRIERTVLGQRMLLPVGAVYMAWKSEAPLLPLVTWFEDGRVVTEIFPPVDLPRDSKRKDVLESGADIVAAWLERFLREHPSDWHFWDEFQPGRFLVE